MKITFSLRIEENMLKELKYIALKEGKYISELIEQAIKDKYCNKQISIDEELDR